MITQFKFKLFSNDPKFRNVAMLNKNAQQIAINKVYAGQKQLRRKKVIQDTINKKSNPYLKHPDLQVDFIESRIHAFQMMLANDIEELYDTVEKIKITYSERKSIQVFIDSKLKQISNKMQIIDNLIGEGEQEDLKNIQQSVQQIQHLFQQNLQLKKENKQILARIQKKRAMGFSRTPKMMISNM